MAGRGGSPDGVPGGGPDGEDEFGSIVFDESFVRAAGLHEPSARERIRTGKSPRRLRRVLGIPSHVARGALLALVVMAVLGSALYFGARRVAFDVRTRPAAPALLERMSLVPDTPMSQSGQPPPDVFAGTPAAGWSDAAAGVQMAHATATSHFSAAQVQAAELLAREFVVSSQLDGAVLRGARPTTATLLLEAGQRDQLLAAVEHPTDDDRNAATGWLTRFDPATVEVFDPRIPTDVTMHVTENSSDDLMIVVQGSFAYAVRTTPSSPDAAQGVRWTRFVVRRTWEVHATAAELRDGVFTVRRIVTAAGPQACHPEQSAQWFRPLLTPSAAGAFPDGLDLTRLAVDPYRFDAAPVRCAPMTVG